MARTRNDHLAAAAKDGHMSCAAQDYVLMFLSELWKDMKATAATKVKQRGNEDDGDGGEYERFMRATTTQMTGLTVSENFYNHWCLELVKVAWYAHLLQCKFAKYFFLNFKYEL